MIKYLFGCILISFACIISNNSITKTTSQQIATIQQQRATNNIVNRLKQHSLLAKNYATAHHLNNSIGFLIDMKIPSGNYRFFVVDFKMDTVKLKGLVTHGSGSYISNDSLQFSNTPQSGCTSLGMYAVGQSYLGSFGLAYKLHGLNTSNSNAFERFVVLHAHGCLPLAEVAPQHICQSLGCPTVAPTFLNTLHPIIDTATQPIVLYIYY